VNTEQQSQQGYAGEVMLQQLHSLENFDSDLLDAVIVSALGVDTVEEIAESVFAARITLNSETGAESCNIWMLSDGALLDVVLFATGNYVIGCIPFKQIRHVSQTREGEMVTLVIEMDVAGTRIESLFAEESSPGAGDGVDANVMVPYQYSARDGGESAATLAHFGRVLRSFMTQLPDS